MHPTKQIENRHDIQQLVHSFYAKVREDDLIGPIFNRRIAADHWHEHLEKLTDFWESNLLGNPIFRGSPTQKHIRVDKNLEHTIEPKHFERWLHLWGNTLDELYTGDTVDRAKHSAKRMAMAQFASIMSQRPN